MDAATAGDHWSGCRHRLQLQLPLPVSLMSFCSSRSQWMCNDCAGLWIRDGGRQVFKTAERRGSASSAGCEAGYNAMHWVCLWGSSGCWCTTTACTRRRGWSIYWPSLSSRQGGSHGLSDICHTRTVQRRWGDEVLIMDCRGYGTPFLRGIPLPSRCRNTSLSRGQPRIPWMPMTIRTTGVVSGWQLWEGIVRYRSSTLRM